MRNCVLAAICVLAMQPAAAAAQRIDSPYRFIDTRQSGGPFIGYLITGKGNLDLGPRSGAVIGARYDLVISGPFVLEAEVSYFSKTRAVWDTIAGDTGRVSIGDADFGVALALAALRFNLTGPRTYRGILPYVLFGLGAAIDVAGDAALDEDLASDARFDFGTSFAGVLGGGAEIMIGERLGMRLDARNLLWKLKTPRAFLLRGEQARLLPADEWSQNLSLTAGLILRF